MKSQLFIALLAIFVAGCRDKPRLHKFPVEAQNDFLDACGAAKIMTPSACVCMLKQYRIHYSYSEFVNVASAMRQKTLDAQDLDWINRTTIRCVQHSAMMHQDDSAANNSMDSAK